MSVNKNSDLKRQGLQNQILEDNFPKFTTVLSIQSALALDESGKPDARLIQSLTCLRNQLSIRYSELQEDGRISPFDERLLLAEKWLKASSSLNEIFVIWDAMQTPFNAASIALVISLLTSVLSLLAYHYTFHMLAQGVLKNILSSLNLRRLNGYISGTSNELILVTLRLFTEISEKWERKKVLEGFPWELKSLPKLFGMHRKSSSSGIDPIIRPDIRTAYILFLLSFLQPATSSTPPSSSYYSTAQIKTLFLTSHSTAFCSIFKGLNLDHPNVVKRVLEVAWVGLWNDVKVSRSLKIEVFGETIVGHLLKLYERNTPEGSESQYTAADLAHHFLLGICTRPGIGICFKDRGWYPRESTDGLGIASGDADADDEVNSFGGKMDKGGVPMREVFGKGIHNKILANVLKALKVTDDLRQQELALKILEACPELVAGYLPASGLTLDPPRLSSKWLANITFFASVLSLPVPTTSFLLPISNISSTLYRPSPPALNVILGNILPSSSTINTKNIFSKGLQFTTSTTSGTTNNKEKGGVSPVSAGNLVQHTTCIALIRCLEKFVEVKRVFEDTSKALGEDGFTGDSNGGGLWGRRWKEVQREVRRRLPEFQVVVGFWRNASTVSSADKQTKSANATKAALLAECGTRMLWMYQRCLPEVVEGARFDVGKMLLGFEIGSSDLLSGSDKHEGEGDAMDEQEDDTATRLNRIIQLHILRFLRESPQFMWMEKNGTTGYTHLYTLLIQLVHITPAITTSLRTSSQPYQMHIRTALASLVKHLLGSSILFQEDPEEVGLWLMCLPTSRRRDPAHPISPGKCKDKVAGVGTNTGGEAEAPDGTPLTDERSAVIAFLDECVQRCLKTPYKYIEEARTLLGDEEGRADGISDTATGTPSNTVAMDTSPSPSPLLFTLIEQLDAKVGHRLLTPSDLLAVTMFMRKLIYRLLSKVDADGDVGGNIDRLGLSTLNEMVRRLDSMLSEGRLFAGDAESMPLDGESDTGSYNVMKKAVRREVCMMWKCLGVTRTSDNGNRDVGGGTASIDDAAVDLFLGKVESLPILRIHDERELVAYELIDWLRLLPRSPNASQLRKLLEVVRKYWEPALGELIQTVDISEIHMRGELWKALDVVTAYSAWAPFLPFEWLFLHTGSKQIVDEDCRFVLVQSVFGATSVGRTNATMRTEESFAQLMRVLRLVIHTFVTFKHQGREDVCQGLLLLLAEVMTKVLNADLLSESQVASLKQILFGRKSVLKRAILGIGLGSEICDGVVKLQQACLRPTSAIDRLLVLDISLHWMDSLKKTLIEKNYSVPIDFASTWINYLEPPMLFDFLDILSKRQDRGSNPETVKVLRLGLEPLCSLATSDITSEISLGKRLPQLLQLRSSLPTSDTLEGLIATSVGTTIPFGLMEEGHSSIKDISNDKSDSSLAILAKVEIHWSQRTTGVVPDVWQFLRQDTWSDATVRIISGSLYKRALIHQDEFTSWLESEACRQRSADQYIPVLYAFLDCVVGRGESLDQDIKVDWSDHLSRMLDVAADCDVSQQLRQQAGACIRNILSISRSQDIATPLGRLVKQRKITPELVALGNWLSHARQPDRKPNSVPRDLVDEGLQWVIRWLADDSHVSELTTEVIRELTSLIAHGIASKSATVETLLIVVVQQHLSNAVAIQLTEAALKSTNLKPLIVNRHLQSIIQHPQFFKICTTETSELSKAREAIVHLLHTLFFLHPINTCQVSHVEPLIRIYSGTISVTDLKIFSILQLFEKQRKLSVALLFSHWSPSAGGMSSTSLDALQALDPVLVLRASVAFPRWRRLDNQSSSKTSVHDANLYDPLFLMLLFGQMLADNPPESAISWIELFRTNIVGLFIRALSSKDGRIRDLALCEIVALWKNLQEADLQERPHVLYVLTLLKNILPLPSTEQYPLRLPSYTTLLLFYALRGIFNPSNFTYPLIARFLLQRSEFDISDVPMLYGMLYSSSDNWKKERGWIVRFLADGMMNSQDWKVLKRRHTWDLLASMFQSSGQDHALRHGVLDVLANLTNHPQATMSLVLKSGLLSWIEMQLRLSTMDGLAWIKILENVSVSVDSGKLESSSLAGEWRATICRCLELLLEEGKSAIFPHAVPVILRLSLLPGMLPPSFMTVLDLALKSLQQLEANLKIPSQVPVSHLPPFADFIHPAPHSTHGLHEGGPIGDLLPLWGCSVEMLWQAVMNTHEDREANMVWDKLTSRLLFWRKVAGASGSPIGEWARVECVRNL